MMMKLTSIKMEAKPEKVPEGPKKSNDLREIRSIKQLANVNLDLESPRMKQALENLGIAETELEKK